MIILDLKPFADNTNDFFKTLNENEKYEIVEIKKAIYDSLKIDENSDITCSPIQGSWGYDTIFLANFQQSLEAGNIELHGLPINKLRIRKRKKDNLRFETINEFDFDPDKLSYEMDDRLVESHEDYVYGIQPLGGSNENPVSGNTTISEIYSEFESVWLVNKNTQYQLFYDLDVGSYETHVPSEVKETLGRQYPIVFSNGAVNYRRGNISCAIISDETYNKNKISPKEEKEHRKLMMKFLSDKKPKLYKDGSGEAMVIMIMGNPTLSPRNDLNQLIYDISLEFVEIADTNTQDLINAGLVEV